MGCVIWLYVELKAFEVSMEEGGSFLWLENGEKTMASPCCAIG
jgi:hypothetical protein